jgi:hypothetical protein
MQNIPELQPLSSGEIRPEDQFKDSYIIDPILIKNQADNPDS